MKINKIIFGALLISCWCNLAIAQESVEISGQPTVSPGMSYGYTAVFKSSGQIVEPTLLTDGFSWSFLGGDLEYYSAFAVQVKWTVPGTHLMEYSAQTWDNYFHASMQVTVGGGSTTPGEGDATAVVIYGMSSGTVGLSSSYTAEFRNSSGQSVTPPSNLDDWGWYVNPINSNNIIESSSQLGYQIKWMVPGNYTVYYYAQTLDNHFFSYTLPVTIPVSAPSATAATNVTTNSFIANWIGDGATSYRLDVARDVNFILTVPGYSNLSVNGTSQSVSGLEAGIDYYYRIRSVFNSQVSNYSNTINQRTLPDTPVANPPSSFTTTSFVANWSSVLGEDYYLLEIGSNNSFSSIVATYNVYGTNQNVTGLSAGTSYFYRVTAKAWFGSSGPSNIIETITIPNPPLAAATNITAYSFFASWSSSVGASGYRIDVALNPSFSQVISSEVISGSNKTVTGLTPGTVYYYHVRAENASGSSINSNGISIQTLPVAPIATAATGLTTTSFTANWNTVSDVIDYLVEISNSNSFTTIVTSYTTTSSSQNVTGLSSGGTFFYRVIARNESGSSLPSNIIQTGTLPDAPVATKASGINSSSFVANWNSVTASGYQLDVSTDINFLSFIVGYNNLSVGTTNASVPGLVPAKYYYRVRAVNALGNSSANSNVVEVTEFAHNYIRTIVATVSGKTTLDQLEVAPVNERLTKYDFFDGLGRLEQSVSVNGSPSFQDIIQPVVYDLNGRESRRYLPYTDGNSGWYKTNALKDPASTETNESLLYKTGKQYSFYQLGGILPNDQVPYSETVIEASPINRPLKEYGPGEDWSATSNNKFVEHQYPLNVYDVAKAQHETIVAWKFDTASGMPYRSAAISGLIETGGYYSSNQLTIRSTKDESGNEIREYSDKEGHLVLKKVQAVSSPMLNNSNHWAQTYYIYDDFGNLMMVVQPEGVEKLVSLIGGN